MSLTKKLSTAALTAVVLGTTLAGTAPATAATTTTATNAAKACASPNFKDVSSTTNFYKATTWLRCEGLSKGYSDGTFKINRQITRGEVAALLYRHSGETHKPGTKQDFTDVKPGRSYFTAISWMEAKNITNGYANGSFGVNKSITRGELSAFLMRASGASFSSPTKSPYTDMKKGDAFYGPATWLYSTKLVSGYADGSFKPTRKVTRGETAAFMYAMETRITGTSPTYTVPKPIANGTNGRGGAYADSTKVAWSNGKVSSRYHIYASHLDKTKPHGVIVYMHGDGGWEYNYPNSGSPTGEYIKIARANNLMLTVPKTPDSGGTWWKKKTSGEWAADLFDNIGKKYNVDLKKTYWVGFSGGADVISEQIVQTHSDGWTGGSALLIGGGPGKWGYLGKYNPISSGLKSSFPMYWLVGSKDSPSGGGAGDDGYDALHAAKDGHKYYTGLGMKTKLNIISGAGHVDAAWDGPAMLKKILAGKA